MLGRAARVIPVEFVVRGYITGSGWKEYQRDGTVCGITLPEGLKHCEQLPEPIFTPATKATKGHDENIDFDTASTIAGRDVMDRLRDVSVEIYRRAAEYARDRGIILADTKFEFGIRPRRLWLRDRRDHVDRRSADARLKSILASRRL